MQVSRKLELIHKTYAETTYKISCPGLGYCFQIVDAVKETPDVNSQLVRYI